VPAVREQYADSEVQEKFMLDLSEEDAIKQFEALLNDTSYLTVMFDRIHDWLVAHFSCRRWKLTH
jgi:hypothetical protein